MFLYLFQVSIPECLNRDFPSILPCLFFPRILASNAFRSYLSNQLWLYIGHTRFISAVGIESEAYILMDKPYPSTESEIITASLTILRQFSCFRSVLVKYSYTKQSMVCLLFFHVVRATNWLSLVIEMSYLYVNCKRHLIQLSVASCTHCLNFHNNTGVLEPTSIWVLYNEHIRNYPATVEYL